MFEFSDSLKKHPALEQARRVAFLFDKARREQDGMTFEHNTFNPTSAGDDADTPEAQAEAKPH